MSFLVTKILPENLYSDSQLESPEVVLDKLYSQRNKKLFLLKAPKGFGKSSLISLFISQKKFKYSYFKTDDEDDNLYTFLDYLINSVDKSAHGFVNEIKALLDYYKSRFNKKEVLNNNSIFEFTKALINHIYLFIKDDFYIIIDDAENISNHTWAHVFLNYFIENSPKNIHFIFLTKGSFPFDEAKFKLTRNFIEVGNNDLRVDIKLLQKIAENIYSLKLTSEVAGDLIKKTNGWITGIHILLQSINTGVYIPEDSSITDSIKHFFEKEIILKINKKYFGIFAFTSLFESFDEPLLAFLYSKNLADDFLETMKTKYGFIFVSKPGGDYEYLSFFKEFLKEKFKSDSNEKNLKRYYQKAAKYYIKQQDKENTIKYLIKAEDYKILIPILLKCILENIKTGDFNIIDKWLSKLPLPVFVNYPFLNFYKGLMYKNYRGDSEKAIKLFNLCIKNSSLKEEYFIKSICRKAEIFSTQGKSKEALTLLNRVSRHSLAVKNKLEVIFGLVSCYYRSGDFKNSLRVSEEALAIFSKNKNPEYNKIKISILNTLGTIYAVKGEFKKAAEHFKQSFKNVEFTFIEFQVLMNYSYVSLCLGNFEEYNEIYNRINSHSIIKELPLIRSSFEELSLQYLYEQNQNGEALKKADTLIEYSVNLNLFNTTLYAYIIKAKIYFYLNQFDLMIHCVQSAKKYETNVNEGYKILLQLFEHIYNNNIEGIKLCLNYFSNNDQFDDRIFTLFRLAEFYLKNKKDKQVKEILFDGFILSEKSDYYNCAIKEFFYRRKLFDFTISENIQNHFTEYLISEIFQRKKYLYEFSKIYDIELHLFGIPEIYVRGIKIESNVWKRNKFKLMFIYLLLNKNSHITKDVLIDEFFPDADIEYSDNIFHQFLSNMRSVLKAAGSQNLQLMQYKNKYFELSDNCLIYIDYNEFVENSKNLNKVRNSDSLIEILKNLEKISRKEFMSGHYDTWIEDSRSEVNSFRLKFLRELVELTGENLLMEDSSLYYEELLKSDNTNEQLYVGIIKFYLNRGDKIHAKKKLKKMIDAFIKETGTPPDAKILYEIEELIGN